MMNSMKTIKIFDKEMSIKDEFDVAFCVWETKGTNLDDYTDQLIEVGQAVFDVKILESGSIIYKIEGYGDSYFVNMFPQMFGFPEKEQIDEIKFLRDEKSKISDRITEIYESIKRTGFTDIK